MLELGGFGEVAFPWPDRLQHANSEDVTFEETLITSLVLEDAEVSVDAVIQREAKTFQALQLAFVKSKLFLGSSNQPYTPMVTLMDSTLKVYFHTYCAPLC